jgi:F-type H+/Na+-transporting ATPase subunit beta
MTGNPGRFVTLDETLESCERILSGEFADRDEGDFYMIGSITTWPSRGGADAA